MRTFCSMWLVAVFAVLASCGPSVSALTPIDDSSSVSSGLSARASLYFRGDSTVTQSAALMVGGEARIEYDASRVKNCQARFGDGTPAWSTAAYVRLPSGNVKSFTVAGRISDASEPMSVTMDVAGTAQVWFQTTNRWGCMEWDSNYGANYRFEVFAPAVVHFNVDRTISIQGSLRGARAIAVDYPLSLLPNCRQTYAGLPSWEILSFARFDGGQTFQATATRVENSTQRVASYAVYAVPEGATSLEVWFLNSDRAGCSEWDSKYGENYRFDLR